MLPNDKPEAVRAVLPIYCHWVTCRYIDADDSGDTDGRTTLQVRIPSLGELERRVDITETSTCIGTQGRVQG
jgi:hypothetical protein